MSLTQNGSPCVLIADTGADFRRALAASLKENGFAVGGECADGREAVRLAKVLNPAAVILDLLLPGLDGAEVIAAVKQAVKPSPRAPTFVS